MPATGLLFSVTSSLRPQAQVFRMAARPLAVTAGGAAPKVFHDAWSDFPLRCCNSGAERIRDALRFSSISTPVGPSEA